MELVYSVGYSISDGLFMCVPSREARGIENVVSIVVKFWICYGNFSYYWVDLCLFNYYFNSKEKSW